MKAASRYCIDSNVLIQAKNGPYRFSVVPQFWNLMDREIQTGRIYCPRQVYDELTDGEDELSSWVKDRKGKGDFGVEPRLAVQERLREISTHVVQNFEEHHAAHFLEGADPWLIAQAWADGSRVVTWEKWIGKGGKRPKIPNICKNVCREPEVVCIDTYDMLEELGGL